MNSLVEIIKIYLNLWSSNFVQKKKFCERFNSNVLYVFPYILYCPNKSTTLNTIVTKCMLFLTCADIILKQKEKSKKVTRFAWAYDEVLTYRKNKCMFYIITLNWCAHNYCFIAPPLSNCVFKRTSLRE